MSKILYFDCFSGISGDMTLGAMLDAGLKLSALTHELKRLGISGYTLKTRRVFRKSIAATKFDVVVTGRAARSHRSLRSILKLIGESPLSPRVKSTAKQIFTAIGQAEAKVHGLRKGKEIDFHELGELDSIVDIVGTAIALDSLGIDEVYSSPLTMGRTVIISAHGPLPIPGPATLELTKGIPVKIGTAERELVTPTGAGIVRTVAKGFGPMPLMRVERVGYGAGAAELAALPNVLRVIIGERLKVMPLHLPKLSGILCSDMSCRVK